MLYPSFLRITISINEYNFHEKTISLANDVLFTVVSNEENRFQGEHGAENTTSNLIRVKEKDEERMDKRY